MDNFKDLMQIVSNEEITNKNGKVENTNHIKTQEFMPFNIRTFADEIRESAEKTNKEYIEHVQTISAYAIANDCIAHTVKKILGIPVKSFSHAWLPIAFRSTLGSAVHDFIQKNSNQFTELEVSTKIPSIRFSGRLDAMIGPNILCEIKSLPYTDYRKVIKKKKPRDADFYQTMIYKYILENHLDEAKKTAKSGKTMTNGPKLDHYEIQKIQYIYVAHDICSSDMDNVDDALKMIKQLKTLLNSKRNPFFFISTIVLDTSTFDCKPFNAWIEHKIKAINKYVDEKIVPDKSDPYIDNKKCFFCPYRIGCNLKK